jgi:iron transport multicopper oxidase
MGSRLGVAVLSIFFLLAFAGQAMASGITNAGEDMRTGWYPDEPSINPGALKNGGFGEEWDAKVDGQVYAQPLLDASTLLVATENNTVYGLDPASGAQRWSANLGTTWNPAEIGCGDLKPTVGVTATPVIDPATNVAYMTHKTGSGTSVRWYMDALDMSSGAEKAGFPVELSGSAQNEPGQTFLAKDELQRPGLLLMDGVVYAGFGSDCDIEPFKGWVFGVSESGAVTARWTSTASGRGGGIWQSGAGLVSDGPGTILLVTGNGSTPTPGTPGDKPPANLSESVVRLRVQGTGQLKATDFFAPFNAEELASGDTDFASSGITALPDSFGTPSTPHLAVAAGKEGYVYLLNRDNLGGIATTVAGEIGSVVQKTENLGGVWSRPAVWPGEGGWVYIPTASPGMTDGGSAGFLRVYRYGLSKTGKPQLSLAGTSEDEFGFSSGAAAITSNGTTPGSAVVWVEWAKNGSGEGAQLRAYAPLPVNEAPVELWHESIGTSAKFAVPGVGGDRLFVGTSGHVLGFGLALSGAPTDFPPTQVGSSTEQAITLTASRELEIVNLSAGAGPFATSHLAHPLTLAKGGTVTVPVTFTPTSPGRQAGAMIATIRVSGHEAQIEIPLSGTGEEAAKPPTAPRASVLGVVPFTGPGTSKGPGPLATLTSRALVVGRNGVLSLRLSCPGGESACAGTVSLQTLTAVRTTGSKRARILTLASASFRVAGGHTTTVHLRLSPFGRRLLARNHRIRLRAVIAAHDAAGRRHTTRLIVTVRAARSR